MTQFSTPRNDTRVRHVLGECIVGRVHLDIDLIRRDLKVGIEVQELKNRRGDIGAPSVARFGASGAQEGYFVYAVIRKEGSSPLRIVNRGQVVKQQGLRGLDPPSRAGI